MVALLSDESFCNKNKVKKKKNRNLWFKINKLINYLISQIFLVTYIITFEPETPAGHPKYQKTWIVV